MNIFNLFGLEKNTNDPYWEFDKTIHYRPKLNNVEFYKLTGYDFIWLLFEPLADFISIGDNEKTKVKSLSYGQKTILYWSYIDGQVNNGGFIQFYHNGYASYVPTIINGLKYIGDKQMASLIQKADNIYHKNKELFEASNSLVDSFLYDKLPELDDLDNEYYKISKMTITNIVKYIKRNPNEFCLNETGNEFNTNFSGEYKTFYNNNQIKEFFYIENGIITDVYRSFYENGNPKEIIHYLNGELTGELEEFYKNGNKKYIVKKDEEKNLFEHLWYYENGNPKLLEYKQKDKNYRIGEYKKWYDNGQIAEKGTYNSNYQRTGELLEFYMNGMKKLEAEYKNNDFLISNFWDKNGAQTIAEGTGVYSFETNSWDGNLIRHVQEYKNYIRHGKQYTYINGELSNYEEMEHGIKNGISRNYFKSGNVKEETIFKNGKEISKKIFYLNGKTKEETRYINDNEVFTKKFPLFENPIIVTEILYEINEEFIIELELDLPDKFPIPINAEEIGGNFNAPLSLFDDFNQNDIFINSFLVTIDENGNPIHYKLLMSNNLLIFNLVLEAISKLKFKPAMKNHNTVKSCCIIKFISQFDEK